MSPMMLPIDAPLADLRTLAPSMRAHELACVARSITITIASIAVTPAGYVHTRHDGSSYVLEHGWSGADESVESVARAPVAATVSTAVAVRCGCWHRTDGTHASNCPATDAGDFLPPHRETWKDVRAKIDGEWKTVGRECSLVPPVVREPVTVAPVAEVAATAPAAAEPVAVLDTETTGLRPDGRVCEIAVAIVDLTTGKVIARASQLIDPGPVLMPAAAFRVHGISDTMLIGMPKLSEVWPKITAFIEKHLKDCPALDVIAHNAPFDRGILGDDLARHGIIATEWPRWHWRDSITLSKRIIPGLPTYSLHDGDKGMGLASRLNLPKGGHRALGDVITTCALLTELRKRVGKPWSEWRGDAHVWGVGVQRELAPAKVKTVANVAIVTSAPPVAAVVPTPAPVALAVPVAAVAPAGAPLKARPRTVKAQPPVVRDLFAAGGSR